MNAVNDFLSFNKKNSSGGYVDAEFDIQYYVGEDRRFEGKELVTFDGQDVQIPYLDKATYHTAFSPKSQDYYFEQTRNILFIENNNTKNKFGKPYKIKIYG